MARVRLQLWWRDTPVPPHVPVEEHPEYRTHMEREVRESCELLASALDNADVRRFAPLFEPEVTAHLLGMFELNNLAVLVASPVEMFFVEADPAGGAADESTEPHMDTLLLLGALGDAYQIPCEGTGFYALQVGARVCMWVPRIGEKQVLPSSKWRTGENAVALVPSERHQRRFSHKGSMLPCVSYLSSTCSFTVAGGWSSRACRAAATTAAHRARRRQSRRR